MLEASTGKIEKLERVGMYEPRAGRDILPIEEEARGKRGFRCCIFAVKSAQGRSERSSLSGGMSFPENRFSCLWRPWG